MQTNEFSKGYFKVLNSANSWGFLLNAFFFFFFLSLGYHLQLEKSDVIQ